MSKHVSLSDWYILPAHARLALGRFFNLPRSTGVQVTGGYVVTNDGYTESDLKSLMVQMLEDYTQTTGDTRTLVEAAYTKFISPEEPWTPLEPLPEPVIEPVVEVKKVSHRKTKKSI